MGEIFQTKRRPCIVCGAKMTRHLLGGVYYLVVFFASYLEMKRRSSRRPAATGAPNGGVEPIRMSTT
jgi:hypothetical protein